MRLRPAALIAVAIALGGVGTARAEAPLVMEEPTSGLRLEVEGACQVRPSDGGSAACQQFAASADKSERFAVVLGPSGLLSYSVAIFAERESGTGEVRARRVSTTMGEAVVGSPSLMTYGEQLVLRAQLRTSNGAALCFITADESPEIAIFMFATEPGGLAAMEPKVEIAMRTLRRARKEPPAVMPAATMSRTSKALLSAFLLVLFGLPVVRFIARAVRQARRRAGPQMKRDTKG